LKIMYQIWTEMKCGREGSETTKPLRDATRNLP
jgi:hypothetical protein